MRMRRKLDTFIGQTKNIPTNYTECEYLEINRRQWIQTDYLVPVFSHISIDVEILSNPTNFTSIFSARGFNQATAEYALYDATLGSSYGIILRPYWTPAWKRDVPLQTKINITYTDTEILLDNILWKTINTSGMDTIVPDQPLCLFGTWNNASRSSARIYSCIAQNTETAIHLIPCLDENKIPCMYDLISGQTFRNKANGTFGYKIKATGETVAPDA